MGWQPPWSPEDCEIGSRTTKEQQRASPQTTMQWWSCCCHISPCYFPERETGPQWGRSTSATWQSCCGQQYQQCCVGNTRNRVGQVRSAKPGFCPEGRKLQLWCLWWFNLSTECWIMTEAVKLWDVRQHQAKVKFQTHTFKTGTFNWDKYWCDLLNFYENGA